MSTITTLETRIDAMRRLLEVARESGVRLGTDPGGDFWATSVSEPGRLYRLTPESRGCRGFQTHRRCRHVAALWSHLGFLDDEPTPPAAAGPVVDISPIPQTCTTCDGSGWEHITLRIRNRYVDSAVRCTTCEGHGAIAA